MTRALDLSVEIDVPELASIGLTLSRAALTRGVLALGGTGSGKTSSVVLPLLRAVLNERERAPDEHRSAVVCIDPKHELGEVVRASCSRVIEVGASGAHPLDVFASMERSRIDAGAVVDRYLALSGVSMDPTRDGFWRTGARDLLRDCVAIDLHCLEQGGAIPDGLVRRAMVWKALASGVRDAGRISPAEARLMMSPRRTISRFLQLIRLMVRDSGAGPGVQSSASLLQRVLMQHLPELALPALNRLTELSSETASSLSATAAALMGSLSSERVQSVLRLDVLPPLRTTPVTSLLAAVRSGGVVLFQPGLASEEDWVIARAVKAAAYDAVLAGAARTSEGAVQRLVALFVDEAQEVMTTTGVSDAAFLAVGRAFGSAPVFASQSLAAIRDRLPAGSHDAVRSVVANLATRIQLATTDPDTINELRPLIEPPPVPGPHVLEVRPLGRLARGEAYFVTPGNWGVGVIRLSGPTAG